MARDSYDLIFWNWIFLHISRNSTSKYYYLNSRFKEIMTETWSRRQKRLHMAGPSHDCSLLFLHPPPWIPSPRSLNSDSGHSTGQALRHWATPSQLNSDKEDHVLPRPCPRLRVTKKTGLGKVMGAKKTIFQTRFRKSNHLPTVGVKFFPRPVGGLCHSCLHTKALSDTRRELLLSENTERLVSSKWGAPLSRELRSSHACRTGIGLEGRLAGSWWPCFCIQWAVLFSRQKVNCYLGTGSGEGVGRGLCRIHQLSNGVP